ncbi:MAG: response regulator [Myxococcota bacterium]
MSVRVMLVDDHALVRLGMMQLISTTSDIEVVAELGDGWAALELLQNPQLTVDVMIIDLSMPHLSGLELLRRSLKLKPTLAVLVVSMYAESEYTQEVLSHGAAGYLSKDRAHVELIDAIRAVAHGRTYIAKQVGRPSQGSAGQGDPHLKLSPRELQIFMLLVEGRAVGEISAELSIGISTVSTHLGRIREKLGVTTVADMVHYAYRHGLVT